jgi:hypothetical protein
MLKRPIQLERLTRRCPALVDVFLAAVAGPTLATAVAGVAADAVHALAPVLALVTGAVVQVLLAVAACAGDWR